MKLAIHQLVYSLALQSRSLLLIILPLQTTLRLIRFLPKTSLPLFLYLPPNITYSERKLIARAFHCRNHFVAISPSSLCSSHGALICQLFRTFFYGLKALMSKRPNSLRAALRSTQGSLTRSTQSPQRVLRRTLNHVYTPRNALRNMTRKGHVVIQNLFDALRRFLVRNLFMRLCFHDSRNSIKCPQLPLSSRKRAHLFAFRLQLGP
jgi:hypothetical protein